MRRHLVPLTFVKKTFNGKTYGEAEYAHDWGYIGPTTYSVMAMQSTEEGAEGIVNPTCDVISTYNTDGNKTKIIALNPDGSAYTGAVWITILAIGN